MSNTNEIFRSNMVDCPRCLGKGIVDMEDIKRLNKELYWQPGKCAYCNGLTKVPPDRIGKLSADFEYLTADLPSRERLNLINGDEDAMRRADEFKEAVGKMIEEIEHMYYLENMEPGEIADNFFHQQGQFVYSESEKQEVVDFVEKVIKSKLKK